MMASKSEKDRQKQIQEKCQALLTQMLRDEDNKYCVDCDAKGPRWASWNLGIFLCIRCAGIHRNLGVHISKVKSVNLDAWTPEQVVSLQQMGNSRARAVYEANLPDNFRRPQTDSSLEAFVRAKYEQKKYIAREWVPPPIPKVNWDKELDEEAEKLKKKKKEAKQQQIRKTTTPLPEVPLPQPLPKPKGSSPKINRTSGEVARNVSKPVAQDLLGLDNPVPSSSAGSVSSKDEFSSFLSASPAPDIPSGSSAISEKTEELNKGLSEEEENFFNQTTPKTQEKHQLSKDSIMALYSTVSSQAQSINPQVFGVPGGMYTQSQPCFSQNVQAVSYGIPNNLMSTQPLPTGVMQNGVFPNAGVVPPQTVTGFSSNPFYNISSGTANPAVFQQVTQDHTIPTATSQDLLSDFGMSTSNSNQKDKHQQNNMISQLPQQFMKMNIGCSSLSTPQAQSVLGMSTPLQGIGVQMQSVNMPQGFSVPAPTSFPGTTSQAYPSFQSSGNSGHTLATNLWQ